MIENVNAFLYTYSWGETGECPWTIWVFFCFVFPHFIWNQTYYLYVFNGYLFKCMKHITCRQSIFVKCLALCSGHWYVWYSLCWINWPLFFPGNYFNYLHIWMLRIYIKKGIYLHVFKKYSADKGWILTVKTYYFVSVSSCYDCQQSSVLLFWLGSVTFKVTDWQVGRQTDTLTTSPGPDNWIRMYQIISIGI